MVTAHTECRIQRRYRPSNPWEAIANVTILRSLPPTTTPRNTGKGTER